MIPTWTIHIRVGPEIPRDLWDTVHEEVPGADPEDAVERLSDDLWFELEPHHVTVEQDGEVDIEAVEPA